MTGRTVLVLRTFFTALVYDDDDDHADSDDSWRF